MIKLWSVDNAALVLARAILRREPKVELQIFLGKNRPEGAFSASDLWETAIKTSLKKYKRLGAVVDVAQDDENSFLQDIGKMAFPVPYEVLSSMANRQLSDTVEFRRLARKYLRAARNAHCDGLLFLSGILADEQTCKILATMSGTQTTAVFVTEFLPEEFFRPVEKQSIEIIIDQNIDRVHAEAEKFLHMKLAKGAVKHG